MSMFLGNQRIGVSQHVGEILNEGDEVLRAAQKSALNDGIGKRVGDYNERTIAQMIEDAKRPYLQQRDYNMFTNWANETWVRPQGWPDLDSLNLQMSGDDFIYMTYDNTHARAAIALYVEKVSKGTDIKVTIGHIANGAYVEDETITGASGKYIRWFTNEDDDYPVVRVTGDIKYCYSQSVTQDGYTQHFRRQPILERIAYVPHLVGFCTSYSQNAWGQFTTQREVINNGDGSALTSLYYAWAYNRDLKVLDIDGLKTQNVTSMDSAFRMVQRLYTLDLHHLNVEKNKNCNSLFNGCKALRTLNLTGWDTSLVTNFTSCFQDCWNLIRIDGLSDFVTNNATTFSSMFSGCWSMPILDVSSWDTLKVTSFSGTFANCYSIQELDLSNWNPNKVTIFSAMFSGCQELKRINFDTWSTKGTGTITSVYAMFANCISLKSIDISWIHLTSSCTSICYMFQNCNSIKEINIPNDWDVSGISNANNNGHSVFVNCWSVQRITGISNWRFQFTNSLTAVFCGCYSLKEIDVSNWTVGTITSLSNMFQNCYSLEELNLTNWNVENCTTFASMFSGCFSLKTIGNISDWNTSKCTSMAGMFRYCRALPAIPDMSDWDFSKVTTIDSMFSECTMLQEVEWKNVSLPLCTSIAQIFRYDYNLVKADLSSWSVPSVTNTTSYYHTLGSCWQLRDVVGFPIPSTYTNLGFQDCESLSYESLMVIINSLPQVTGTHTLRIPAVSLNFLTTAEKAIATNKGWTLANS